jgi:protein SCO1
MSDATRRQFLAGCAAAGPLLLAPRWLLSATVPKQASTPFDGSLDGLVDSQGVKVDDGRYQGLNRIVLFGFTSCADVCPITLLIARNTLKKLGPRSRKVVPIFISFDHEQDSPARLGAYVNAFDKRIQGLTGPDEALRRVAKGHGIFYEKRWVNPSAGIYVYDHTAVILVVDSKKRLVESVSTSLPMDQVEANLFNAISRITPE